MIILNTAITFTWALPATATVYAGEVCVFTIVDSKATKLHFQPLNGSRSKRKIFLRSENEHFDHLQVKSSSHVQNQGDTSRMEDVNAEIDWFDFQLASVHKQLVAIDPCVTYEVIENKDLNEREEMNERNKCSTRRNSRHKRQA